jgi:hypothetical protein
MNGFVHGIAQINHVHSNVVLSAQAEILKLHLVLDVQVPEHVFVEDKITASVYPFAVIPKRKIKYLPGLNIISVDVLAGVWIQGRIYTNVNGGLNFFVNAVASAQSKHR